VIDWPGLIAGPCVGHKAPGALSLRLRST